MIENPTRLLAMRTMWGLFFCQVSSKCPQDKRKDRDFGLFLVRQMGLEQVNSWHYR